MSETGKPGQQDAGGPSFLRAGVKLIAPWRVKALSVLADFRLAVTFQDGTSGIVDLSSVTTSHRQGGFAALTSPKEFQRACLKLGVVTWPSGFELDPVWTHDHVMNEQTWSVPI